jgi:multiple sugar transport system permease protein
VKHARRKLLVYSAGVLLALWSLIPLYWLVNMSLMYRDELISRPAHFYPHNLTITNYLRMFDLPAKGSNGEDLDPVGQSFLVRRGWVNSFTVAVPATLVTLLVALPVGYALGRLRFRFRNGLLFALVSTRAYPPIAVLIPFSALFVAVGLQSSVTGLIIIYLTITIPLIAWIMSGFFASMPRNVERAARIDGLTRWQTFWRVMLPMAAPGVASCAVIAFLICWNEFTFSLILSTGSPTQTFPPTLAGMFNMYSYPNEVAAASVLGLIPPAVLAFMFQGRIRRLNIVDPLS